MRLVAVLALQEMKRLMNNINQTLITASLIVALMIFALTILIIIKEWKNK